MKNSLVSTALAVLAIFTTPYLAAATQHSPPPCQISITSPQDGDTVGRKALVKGTAKIPPNALLWGLISINGLYGFWPQGGGPAILIDGDWTVLSFFGQEHDIGNEFVIYEVAVDETADTALQRWVRRGVDTGYYPPLTSFPNVVEGCPIARVTVTKTLN